MGKTLEPVWMATRENDGRWEDQPQRYIGLIMWADAVQYAKEQPYETRLSTSKGFNNQGHYFRPEKHDTDL